MKNKIFYIVVIFLAVLSVSCSKDWLEMPEEGLIPQDNFYSTNEDNIQGLVAVYDMIQVLNAQDWASLHHIKTIWSDEANGGGNDAGDQPEYHEINNYSFTPGNTKINDIWQRLYYAVYRANVVIANVGEAPNSDIVKAEALALRAYLYFELVNLFDEVPLVLKELVPSEYNMEASTKEQIYAQIETDLKAAIPDLPTKAAQEPWRIADGFANALMGKALIFQGKYTDAIPYLEAVSGYSLFNQGTNPFADVLKIPSEYGSESLFEIGYVSSEGWNWGNYNIWDNGRAQENNIHWILCGPREGYYNSYDTTLIDGSGDKAGIVIPVFQGWGAMPPTKKMYDKFEGTDPRRKSTVLSNDELMAPEYNASLRQRLKIGMDGSDPIFENFPTGSFQYQGEGILRLKYGTWKSEGGLGDGDEPGLNMGTNLRVMRYAEVLLLKAEAYVKAGRAGDAIPLIQQLHDRAGYDAVVTSVDMDVIEYERIAELSYEGHRFYDMVRWGRFAEMSGADVKYSKLPIPQPELDSNPNLSQNSYWK